MTPSEAVKRFVTDFTPGCEQEARDRAQILAFCRACPDAFSRENATAHFSASAWVVDARRERALMAYHNLYGAWAWTGGHADGDTDLMRVALREVWEETGVRARPVSARSFSIESLCVAPHIKRGAYVSAHIHMNVTFLMEADPNLPPRVKPDENSAVMWMPFEKIDQYCSEVGMLEIYRKLMWRARQIP